MARKTTKATAAKDTETKATKEAPKYGVNDLAEAVGIAPASVRVALRALEVEKNFGNQYGWNTKKDFDEVVKALKERNAKSAVADKAPAKKAPAKTTRKPRGKAAAK